MIHLLWFLRGLAGIAIGFFIARKLRDFIRSIVIMCIPLKHRISERSFQIQTRITTLVSILLMIVIAAGLNIALSKGLTKMGISEKTTLHRSTTTPVITWPTKAPVPTTITKQAPSPPIPEPVTLPKATSSPIGSIEKSVITPPINPVISQPIPTANPYRPVQKTIPFPPTSSPVVYHQTADAFYPMLYYAQVYAFRDFNKAQRQQLSWNSRSQLPVRIGFIRQELAPYKVIIGPFRNRQAASTFMKNYQVRGFVRPAHQLQLFE